MSGTGNRCNYLSNSVNSVLIDLQHVTGHNMLVHVIWPEIARRLEQDLTRAFSSGIIATFHAVRRAVRCLTRVI